MNIRPTVDNAFVQQAKLVVSRPTHFLIDKANLFFFTVVIKNFILVFSVTQMFLWVCHLLEFTTNLHIHISGPLVSKETLFLLFEKKSHLPTRKQSLTSPRCTVVLEMYLLKPERTNVYPNLFWQGAENKCLLGLIFYTFVMICDIH